jgi:hypothetical protein
MKKVAFLLVIIGCMFIITGCKSKIASMVKVSVVNDRMIKVTGIDYAALDELRSDTGGRLWRNFIPVYRMPADTDMKDYQPEQPGKYRLAGTAVSFSPDTPLMKGQLYFIRVYQFEAGTNLFEIIKQRKKLGQIPYTDLIFKP